MTALDELRQALPGLLASQFDEVAVVRGGWSVVRGTARAFVHAVELADRRFITVRIPLVSDVPETPGVFEHLALVADDFLFGSLSCIRTEGDTLAVRLSHTLLADHLQRGEVVVCLDVMLAAADAWDGPFVERFGGHCFRG